jgi:hypothetical protein
MNRRAVNVAFVAILIVGAIVLARALPDRTSISIGFIRYSVKGGGEIWAEYAVTNHSRFDYAISVMTDPHVSTDFWYNTTGLSPAGSVVTNEIVIAKQDESYRLVLSTFQFPVGPPGWQQTPSTAVKCLSRFALGQTRLHLMQGSFVLPTNETFTVRSPIISARPGQ